MLEEHYKCVRELLNLGFPFLVGSSEKSGVWFLTTRQRPCELCLNVAAQPQIVV